MPRLAARRRGAGARPRRRVHGDARPAVGPVLVWLAIGPGLVLVWVVAAKATEVTADPSPPAWLLAPKYLGYGGVGLARRARDPASGCCRLLRVLWRPDRGPRPARHERRGRRRRDRARLGRAAALRKPLAKVAPVLGGLLFALVLLFVALPLGARRDGCWPRGTATSGLGAVRRARGAARVRALLRRDRVLVARRVLPRQAAVGLRDVPRCAAGAGRPTLERRPGERVRQQRRRRARRVRRAGAVAAPRASRRRRPANRRGRR